VASGQAARSITSRHEGVNAAGLARGLPIGNSTAGEGKLGSRTSGQRLLAYHRPHDRVNVGVACFADGDTIAVDVRTPGSAWPNMVHRTADRPSRAMISVQGAGPRPLDGGFHSTTHPGINSATINRMRSGELALLAGCGKMTVLRALRGNKIKGAVFRGRDGTTDLGWEITDAAGRAWAEARKLGSASRKRCKEHTATGPCDTILTRRTTRAYYPCPNKADHLA